MAGLAGRVALVTGGSRGVGKGAALELGAAGARVYVTGRTRSEGQHSLPGSVGQTAEMIQEAGGTATACVCDHRDDEQTRAVFERIEKEAGQLDILVNAAFANPDVGARKRFWDTPISWYDELLDVGTRGAYVASWFAAPLMIARKSGLIVNVSSVGAERSYLHVAYGMGKAAVDKLTRDAGKELLEHGVAVVSIWPSLVKTEFVLDGIERGVRAPQDGAESQRFVGRCVVALARDAKVIRRSRKPFTSRELAVDYGFTDVDGTLPQGSPLPSRR